jgi:Fic family protein
MAEDVHNRIAALKAELDALRPLSEPALAQLQKHFDVELTFTSNAIEGNTLTLRETAEVIEHGITVGGKSLREHLEALDHYEALLWMRALASGDEPVGEGRSANCTAGSWRAAGPTSPASIRPCRGESPARTRCSRTRRRSPT